MASASCILGDNNHGMIRHLHSYMVMRMGTKSVLANAKSFERGSLQNESPPISG